MVCLYLSIYLHMYVRTYVRICLCYALIYIYALSSHVHVFFFYQGPAGLGTLVFLRVYSM